MGNPVQALVFVHQVTQAGKTGANLTAIANVAISANALTKLGNIGRLAAYMTGNRLDETKLKAVGYVLETVDGQEVVRVASEEAISKSIVASLRSQATTPPTQSGETVAVRGLIKNEAASDVDEQRLDPTQQ
jgi:hypothetical protein